MTSNLSNKKSKVLVVDPSGPVRQMMADTVRTALGFEQVEGKASVQDALQHLEIDTAGWIITSIMADQPVNGLHLLKMCTEHPELKGVRVSFCVEDDEKYVLTPGFELGLFSFHHKPFTKDTLTEELKALLAQLEAHHHNEPLTAAHFLRMHLKTTKNWAALQDLEKHLLELFPGNAEVLFHLAEPQFQLGHKDLAKQTLTQVKMLNDKLADLVDTLAKQYFPDTNGLGAPPADGAAPGINVLGASNVVVIDSDEASSKGVEDLLKSLGVPSINRFPNGEAAWEHLHTCPEPDLIITEWRVPKLSGPLLVQRIRHHGFLNVPIVVLSSLLKPDDMPFVRELGVAHIIQKPLNKELFIPGLIWTMQQERSPTEHQVVERKIRNALRANKKDVAEPLRAQYLADPHVPIGRKRLIEAEFAFSAGNYALARDAAVDALKHSGDGIFVLNLLGKAFMRLSTFDAALKCFSKAQQLSPHNLERLCLIAETQTELGDAAAAQDSLADAKALDPEAKQVSEAEVRVAITGGDTAAAKKLMAGFESIDNIVAYMNNKAVALARCGKPNEAVALYKKTLESVPDDKPDPKSIVLYNLALAQIRDGELDAAVTKLNDVLKIKGSKVQKKAMSLKERIKKAQDGGTPFKLKSTDVDTGGKAMPSPTANAAGGAAADSAHPPAPGDPHAPAALASEEDHQSLLAAVVAKRGDLCCFLIFNNPDQADARVTSLLAKAPRFQPRASIERAESLGADRAAKQAG